jgi:hypothetical protein
MLPQLHAGGSSFEMLSAYNITAELGGHCLC